MKLNAFMEGVARTEALEKPEKRELLCEWVRERIDLRVVRGWLDELVETGDPETVGDLASLMELHPLGFEKYVIWKSEWNGPRMRLHYWPENKWPFESIHDHRFHFCSAILCGSYTHEKYEVKKTVGDQVELELTEKTLMRAGDVYYFPAGSFHRVLPSEELTLSLIIRSGAVLPFSRVIDPETKILRHAHGAQHKFVRKLEHLTKAISPLVEADSR
ncbi:MULTISPECIES: hypothetical protein [Cohnella]|uniref:hypothetical protein n=1 Tax=Cohnella TaxID=329857 RepID=UPI0009BAB1C9|nr:MULTISPECIES: hypothetical protein [Cohnella]MBN2982515.1 hypothetical protein [Cohnella algarum]